MTVAAVSVVKLVLGNMLAAPQVSVTSAVIYAPVTLCRPNPVFPPVSVQILP